MIQSFVYSFIYSFINPFIIHSFSQQVSQVSHTHSYISLTCNVYHLRFSLPDLSRWHSVFDCWLANADVVVVVADDVAAAVAADVDDVDDAADDEDDDEAEEMLPKDGGRISLRAGVRPGMGNPQDGVQGTPGVPAVEVTQS